MRGRSGLVATLMCGVVLASVAACGGGGSPPAVFRPAGSPAARANTVGTPVTSAPGGYRFPAGVSVQFSSSPPASPARRAIVTGYQNYVLALWAAVLSHGHDTAYQRWASGNAEAFVRKEISFFGRGHRGLAGTIRYSATTVSADYFGRGATVTSCVDSSAFRVTGSKAGPVFPPKFSHYLEDVAEGRRPDGTWFVAHTESFPATTSEGAMCR
jgi:hypothetical protein